MPEKTVLVTGGAAGIGAGLCLRFSEAGYNVAVFDINSQAATALASQLDNAIAIAGDVADEQHVIQAIHQTVASFGSLDVLINNAGIEVNGTVADLTAAEWDRQLAVNLRGTFLMSKYAVAKMIGRGGAIINISSVHAFVSWPACPAYDTTKAGLIGLTRALALDHGAAGIRVNAICPGYIDTPLMQRWLDTLPDRDDTMRKLLAIHPIGRIGTPRDIAEAALFLASDAASFISGTTLVIDGAMTTAGH